MAATAPDSADCEQYYKMEDATDEVGSNDLTISGATSGSTGKINNCYDFDGTNDQAIAATPTNSYTAYSISAWVKADSVSGNRTIATSRIDTVGNGDGMLIIVISGVPRLLVKVAASVGQIDATTTLSTGTWYHIVGTWDGTNYKIYVDGTLENTGSKSGTMTTATTLCLGAHRTASTSYQEYWDGLIDEVGTFDVGLTADNVEYLYNSGSPGSAQQYQFTAAVNIGNLNKWNGVDATSIAKINGKTIQ